MLRRFLSLAVAALFASGCAVGSVEPAPAPEPRPELAARPEPLARDDSPTSAGAAATSGTSPTSSTTTRGPSPGDTATPQATAPQVSSSPGAGGPGTPTATASAPTSAEATGPSELAAFADARGDLGLDGGPGHADLVHVTIADTGPALRVSIDVADDVPAELDDGEIVGLGVDIWNGTPEGESDFQLFADGGVDGWYAYLQTRDGFVEYPGSFHLGGSHIVFEVPWDALGGLRDGHVAVFLDWSRKRPLINAASSDLAPEEGTTPFAR